MADPVFYLDGAFLAADQARVSVLDRGFVFGDAVYEVLRVQNGRPFRTGDHYARMTRGLDFLRIRPPFSPEEYQALCSELIARNGVQQGLIYLQVTRGVVERTHLIPEGLTPTVMGFARGVDLPKGRDLPDGASAVMTPDLRWQRCDIKTTMLLPNSLAKQLAHEAGAFEAILVSPDGVVREGSSTNVFAVRGGVAYTHPTDCHILPGITRQVVLQLASEAGIPTTEEAVTGSELVAAEEVFVTGTASDVCPIVRVDDARIGQGTTGPVTRKLMEIFAERLEDETGRDAV